jgi:hypothetical protein
VFWFFIFIGELQSATRIPAWWLLGNDMGGLRIQIDTYNTLCHDPDKGETMKLKAIWDETLVRGEKLKDEVVAEILKTKTVKEIVTNKYFINAVTRVIETKEEVKRALGKQMKVLFHKVEVPTQIELKSLAAKLKQLEKIIDKLASTPKKRPVKSAKKKSAVHKKKSGK